MVYDFLIIGAGLAGCAAADLLTRSGYSVLVVDRADLCSKDKLCGGLLTPRAWRMLRRLYGDDPELWARLVSLVKQEHRSMHVIVGSHQQMMDGVMVRACRRIDLDRFALRSALDAGAAVVDSAQVTRLDILNRTAQLSLLGSSTPIRFDHLVVADGAGSATRRMVCSQYRLLYNDGLSDERTQISMFGRPTPAILVPSIEAYVKPNGEPLTGKYNAHLRGYDWYAPCGEGANIGCDGAPGTTAAQLREELAVFADQIGITLDEKSIRGACIPSGGSVLLQLKLPQSSVYFIGDAAGLAAPATGEGIYFALRSALSLAESFHQGSPSYRALMFEEAALLSAQYAMLDALFDEELIERIISLAQGNPLSSKLSAKAVLKVCASF